MATIDKLIEILNNQINDINPKSTKITYREVNEMLDLLNKLNYLYCFPNDKKFFNYPIINAAFKENKFFKRYIYPHEEEYQELIKDEKFLHAIRTYGFYETYDDDGIPENPFCFKYRYEPHPTKQDCYILFDHYTPNNNMYEQEPILFLNNSGKQSSENLSANLIEIAKTSVPIEIDGEEKNELLSSNALIAQNDEEYIFKLNHPLFLKYKKNNISNIAKIKLGNLPVNKNTYINKYILDYNIRYLDIDGKLVLKSKYRNGDYNILKDFSKRQSQFLVIDENGNKIDNNSLPAGQILYDIRNAISHCNTYDYEIPLKTKSIVGKVFLIDETEESKNIKNNKSKQFKKAVICTANCISHLMSGYCYNINPYQQNFYFMYSPQTIKQISSLDQFEKLQNKCRIIKLTTTSKVDYSHLESMVKHLINENLTKPTIPLQDLLLQELEKNFAICDVKIFPIANEEWLNQHFIKNNAFLSLPFPNSRCTQNRFTKDILDNYYNPEPLTNMYISSHPNKDMHLKMLNKGFHLIIYNIKLLLSACVKNDTEEIKIFRFFQAYKPEIFHIMCLLLAYNNLIKNGFSENFEYNNIKFDFSPNSKSFKEQIEAQTNSFEQQLHNVDMSNFEVYDDIKKFNGVGRIPKTATEKADVIRFIRNAICHSNIYIKFSKSGSYEDNYIVFYSTNYTRSQPNNVARIKTKDFIKFCQNPLFANYKNNRQTKIEANSFDEVVDKAAKLIKKSLN